MKVSPKNMLIRLFGPFNQQMTREPVKQEGRLLVMGDFGVLHVNDIAVGLEVDVMQASQERLLQDVLDARVVQHQQ